MKKFNNLLLLCTFIAGTTIAFTSFARNFAANEGDASIKPYYGQGYNYQPSFKPGEVPDPYPAPYDEIKAPARPMGQQVDARAFWLFTNDTIDDVYVESAGNKIKILSGRDGRIPKSPGCDFTLRYRSGQTADFTSCKHDINIATDGTNFEIEEGS